MKKIPKKIQLVDGTLYEATGEVLRDEDYPDFPSYMFEGPNNEHLMLHDGGDTFVGTFLSTGLLVSFSDEVEQNVQNGVTDILYQVIHDNVPEHAERGNKDHMPVFQTLEDIVNDNSVIQANEILFKQNAYQRIRENVNVSRGGYTNLTAISFRDEDNRHNLTVYHVMNSVVYVGSGYSLNG
ncbi:hypothetical protein ABES02_29775 [Neobacillus pocheonensis]|uniref:hypothetical protein n=1 Tax=Neobacillus pocheonensis TaxID=363869 RepID=UPI003D271A4A